MVQGGGARLTEQERLSILAELKETRVRSNRAIARAYGVDESAIRQLWKKRWDVQLRTQGVPAPVLAARTRYKPAAFVQLETSLLAWLQLMRLHKLPVPPSLMTVKALTLAESHGVAPEHFVASSGWLKNFRRRHNINAAMLHGEAADVDKDNPQLLAALANLSGIVSTYDARCVFNMDETGLFYRVLPRYTLLAPDEVATSARGRKVPKDRVTVIVCSNSDGSIKVPCTIVGKAVRPACIVGHEWPVPYLQQLKAWVDRPLCLKWFKDVFVPYVRALTPDPVLLIVDNAPGHFDAIDESGVRVCFLPPNCTSWRQPCDLGIIAAFKKRYKFLLLRAVLAFNDLEVTEKESLANVAKSMRAGAAGVRHGRPAHVLDAATFTKLAWDNVSAATVKNAFGKADIGVCYSTSDDDCFGETGSDVELRELVDEHSLDAEEVDRFLHCDDRDCDEYIASIMEEMML